MLSKAGQSRSASVLDVMDAYFPEVDASHKATVLSAIPCRYVVEWTALQRYGNWTRIESNWFGFAGNGADNREGFRRWLNETDVDTIVYLEAIPGPFFWGEEDQPRLHEELRDLLWGQKRFMLKESRDFSHLACRMTIWKR